MAKSYYVIADETTENILVSNNYNEIFEFITTNPNSKLSKIDYKRKPRQLDKRVFLKSYLSNVKNNNKFFELCLILIKGKTNIRHFINTQNLLAEYDNYQSNKNNLL